MARTAWLRHFRLDLDVENAQAVNKPEDEGGHVDYDEEVEVVEAVLLHIDYEEEASDGLNDAGIPVVIEHQSD